MQSGRGSLILTAALCTSMCCIYAEDAVLGTSDEAQSIVLQEDSSQTTEVGSVSVPEDESEQEDLPADSSGQEISPEEPDPSSVFAEEEEQLNQDFVTAEPSLPEEGIQTQEPVFPERTAEELDTDMTSVNPAGFIPYSKQEISFWNLRRWESQQITQISRRDLQCNLRS